MGAEWKLNDVNYTTISDFLFAGFPGLILVPELLGVTFILTYFLTLLANIFIFYVIRKHETLHTPMFIIICNLAVSDVIYSTVISPKIIQTYLFGNRTIKIHLCLVQMYFLHFAGSVDSFILLVMAVDRYVSVCHPLRYSTLITNTVAQRMCSAAWVLGAANPLLIVSYASLLPYCGPNKISHLYCEYGLVVRLACTDTTFHLQMGISVGCLVLLCPFLLILLSYLKIIISVLKITTVSGRMKATYTCSTQLIVITIYFLPRVFVYIAFTAGFSLQGDLRIALGIIYCLLPPILNPVIYSFRLKEIKQVMFKILKHKDITLLPSSS
ncbi:olfactory receptor 6N1-like [Erpetoichthys calabaricus]|uniref:olfactory receptor 6N1-like n=1 Tax=Erpetoichthys calabaricus TaxID=27687 RepID=UPI0010A01A68|nr:olfactory receptor 6N1-like [Erpetoichthys calabaricus]